MSLNEPAIRCITDPAELADVDVFLGRNSLRRIFRMFLEDDDKPFQVNESFRIDAEVIEGIVFLHRWEPAEKRAVELPYNGSSAQSYHREVCDEHPKMAGSEATERVIKYTFGGMKLAVRFQVDATVEDAVDLDAYEYGSCKKSDTRTDTDRRLIVERAQVQDVSQDSLVEIKTRNISREPDLVDLYGQLVFSQTRRLVIARHTRCDYGNGDLTRYKLGKGPLYDIAKEQAPAVEGVARVLKRMETPSRRSTVER